MIYMGYIMAHKYKTHQQTKNSKSKTQQQKYHSKVQKKKNQHQNQKHIKINSKVFDLLLCFGHCISDLMYTLELSA